MPYVQRDAGGSLIAVSLAKTHRCSEWLENGDPALQRFATTLGGGVELAQADLEFIRVLEDLMDVLMEKQVLLFTELPSEAQEKLLKRQTLRDRYRHKLSPLIGDHELI